MNKEDIEPRTKPKPSQTYIPPLTLKDKKGDIGKCSPDITADPPNKHTSPQNPVIYNKDSSQPHIIP
jgi:hypothetical protein